MKWHDAELSLSNSNKLYINLVPNQPYQVTTIRFQYISIKLHYYRKAVLTLASTSPFEYFFFNTN